MACCNNKQRKDIDYVRKLAIAYSEKMEVDVVLHVFSLRGVGNKVYDFTEDQKSVGSNGFVELIKFRKNKSKNVLPHPKGVIGDTVITGSVDGFIPNRIKGKPAKLAVEVPDSNELAKKGEG